MLVGEPDGPVGLVRDAGADAGGAPMIALVAGGGAKTEADTSLAREPRDTLTWSGAPGAAAARAVPGTTPSWC